MSPPSVWWKELNTSGRASDAFATDAISEDVSFVVESSKIVMPWKAFLLGAILSISASRSISEETTSVTQLSLILGLATSLKMPEKASRSL